MLLVFSNLEVFENSLLPEWVCIGNGRNALVQQLQIITGK